MCSSQPLNICISINSNSSSDYFHQLDSQWKRIEFNEYVRITRYVHKIDRWRSLLGRLLLHYCFYKLTRHNSTSPLYQRNSYNKPILCNNILDSNQSFSCNISHHLNYVVATAIYTIHCSQCATSTNKCCITNGIDITAVELQHTAYNSSNQQYINEDTLNELFELMSSCFTSIEWSHIKAPNATLLQQLIQFYRYWCYKESWIKSIGCGLFYPLHCIQFIPTADSKQLIDSGADSDTIQRVSDTMSVELLPLSDIDKQQYKIFEDTNSMDIHSYNYQFIEYRLPMSHHCVICIATHHQCQHAQKDMNTELNELTLTELINAIPQLNDISLPT